MAFDTIEHAVCNGSAWYNRVVFAVILIRSTLITGVLQEDRKQSNMKPLFALQMGSEKNHHVLKLTVKYDKSPES